MSDCMLSDTSSTIYEELLMNKPVITLRTTVEPHKIYWRDMQEPDELQTAYAESEKVVEDFLDDGRLNYSTFI